MVQFESGLNCTYMHNRPVDVMPFGKDEHREGCIQWNPSQDTPEISALRLYPQVCILLEMKTPLSHRTLHQVYTRNFTRSLRCTYQRGSTVVVNTTTLYIRAVHTGLGPLLKSGPRTAQKNLISYLSLPVELTEIHTSCPIKEANLLGSEAEMSATLACLYVLAMPAL